MPNPGYFEQVPAAPRDPILGITEAFQQDARPQKINLGVGVYYDADGRVPLLDCVRQAEAQLAKSQAPHAYLPIDGLPAYCRHVQELVFGDHPAVHEGRIATIQTLGGTGALKVGADLLHRFFPNAGVWISNPSWENHAALFGLAGFQVFSYPYFDAQTRGLDLEGMLQCLRGIPSGSVVLLHACCHNPTGVDLEDAQWEEIIEVINARHLVPLLDMAYQGFGAGLEEDCRIVRRFATRCPVSMVASTFSKSLSLYGERVGALSVVASSAEEARRVLSQLKRSARTNYSNPPGHGARVVSTILASSTLSGAWHAELAAMRERIRQMRTALRGRLQALRPEADYRHLEQQVGLFSYTGLTPAQVSQLRETSAIYLPDTGRICVAALNLHNLDDVAQAMAQC